MITTSKNTFGAAPQSSQGLLPHCEQSSFEGRHKSWCSPAGRSSSWSHTEKLNLVEEGLQCRLRNKNKEFRREKWDKVEKNLKCELTDDSRNFKKISSQWADIHTHHVPQAFWDNIWDLNIYISKKHKVEVSKIDKNVLIDGCFCASVITTATRRRNHLKEIELC